MRTCSICSESKPLDAFERGRTQCKKCRADRYAPCRKAWEASPEGKAVLKAFRSKPDQVAKIKARSKEHYEDNKPAILERQKARTALPEVKQAKREATARWAARNPEKVKASSTSEKARQWHAEYRRSPEGRISANVHRAQRRAAELQATPAWADAEAIKRVYETRYAMVDLTGTEHHVDHIVPLRGRHVCGLHVEANLQILPAAANISKGNRFWPDMP